MTAVASPPKALSSGPIGAADELRQIPLTQLMESPWNPRKHFDPAKLAETAESLRVNGQLTPITVRLTKSGKYEIGAGHRRFRAAPQAGFTSLLAVVRDLDDVAFLELLNIENKQRDDLEPLDEAAGFKLLMEKAGYDVGKLAARIGLSTKYVYDRLKLLQLIPEAKKLLEEGIITAGHAILLARLSPGDQKRAIGNPRHVSDYAGGASGGLFRPEHVHGELDLKDIAVAARSVRELSTWIDDHIRLKPEVVDGFLFPDTAALLTEAKQENEKVVHITYDFLAKSEVRGADKQRVFGERAWKRADGKQKSKTCDWSVVRVVVSGFGRGEAFRVCMNRDRCKTHWGADVARRARRAKATAGGKAQADPYQAQLTRERAERAAEDQKRARWKKAVPALLKALTEKIRTAGVLPDSLVWRLALKHCTPYHRRDELAPGRTVDSLLRYLVYQHLAEDLVETWRPWQEVPDVLKPFGIDAVKIVDQVAPQPVEKNAPAKKAARKSKAR